MYDSSPSDDLQNLEIEFCKVSELFYKSINDLKNYAPFIALDGEENMKESKMNNQRIEVENIKTNYEENTKNYEQLVQQNANEMNTLFDNISNMITNLKNREEFSTSDTELNTKLKELKETNAEKVNKITEQIDNIESLVKNAKTNMALNTQIHKKENENELLALEFE